MSNEIAEVAENNGGAIVNCRLCSAKLRNMESLATHVNSLHKQQVGLLPPQSFEAEDMQGRMVDLTVEYLKQQSKFFTSKSEQKC